MLVKVKSVAFYGLEVMDVDVEVNIANRGLPCFDIVGLPNKSIAESRQRIKSAFQNSGIDFPNKKITVNLAPADIQKDGSFYDLPIAVGIYCAVNKLPVDNNVLFFGELSLDGGLRYTKGVFLTTIHGVEGKFKGICIPHDSVSEAAYFKDKLIVYIPTTLAGVFDHLSGKCPMPSITERTYPNTLNTIDDNTVGFCFKDIIGQETAKRALTISAAGGHHVLMMGPPGVGKTLLATSINSILPPLSPQEAVEVTKIYSVAGKLPQGYTLITNRPFRNPHHTISYTGMVGGGHVPLPGEITLAHRGVLFLDEFCEFPRNVVEVLRQPLEVGNITIARSKGSVAFPSKFILVAAANPCKCGYYRDIAGKCVCSPGEIRAYKNKLSGPILDRIDLTVYLNNISPEMLRKYLQQQPSLNDPNQIKQSVQSARDIQYRRFSGSPIICNNEMTNRDIKTYCPLSPLAEELLVKSTTVLGLSTRAGFKLIKTARTIADLEGDSLIDSKHIAEALGYRKSEKSTL